MENAHDNPASQNIGAEPSESAAGGNQSPTALLKDDFALRAFLSKEINNDSAVFKDFPATRALVRAAILDIKEVLGIK